MLHTLIKDLKALRLPVNEVEISFRPYSKTFYGQYFPIYPPFQLNKKPRVWIYPFNPEGDYEMSYDKILETGIHEMCHHLQYVEDTFVQLKGITHDCRFWQLYNKYTKKALEKGLLRKGVIEHEKTTV